MCVCVCENQVVGSNGQRTKISFFFGGLKSILVCQSNEMKNIWSKTLYTHIHTYICLCVCIVAYSAVIYYYPCHVPHTTHTVSVSKHYDSRVFSFAFKHLVFVLDFKKYTFIHTCIWMC